MKTRIYDLSAEPERQQEAVADAAAVLRGGGLVAFPTETVYGLGANALDRQAAQKIFAAKGRPQDNPLIVHIADPAWVDKLCRSVPQSAKLLMEQFWPGPLTLLLEKSALIPDAVTAGLSSVGIRFPSHPVARALLLAADVPVCAPSANRSGRPSPTTLADTVEDMAGRCDVILGGGSSEVGVESTVLDLTSVPPRILRPGGVTAEQLRAVLGEVVIDRAVTEPLREGEHPRSPGTKYRHYAPKAPVYIVDLPPEAALRLIARKVSEAPDTTGVLCYAGMEQELRGGIVRVYGKKGDQQSLAHGLFEALRSFDQTDVRVIYALCPASDGVGLAVANRLLRAAAFQKITE